jgi:hypothetical protein
LIRILKKLPGGGGGAGETPLPRPVAAEAG